MLEKMMKAKGAAMFVALLFVLLGLSAAHAQSRNARTGSHDTDRWDQTDRERRAAAQAREDAKREFEKKWDLGEQIRKENERSGTIFNTDANRVEPNWKGRSESSNQPPDRPDRHDRSENGSQGNNRTDATARAGNPASIFETAGISPLGHSYLALNEIGITYFSEEQAFAAIFGKEKDFNKVFPFFEAIGKYGQGIAVGNRFNLRLAGGVIDSPVEVVEVRRNLFTVRALPGHQLQGTVTFGFVKDERNRLWLYQIGQGEQNENRAKQLANYTAAQIMWPEMAAKVREIIPHSSVPDSTRSPARQSQGQAHGVPGKTTDGRRYRF